MSQRSYRRDVIRHDNYLELYFFFYWLYIHFELCFMLFLSWEIPKMQMCDCIWVSGGEHVNWTNTKNTQWWSISPRGSWSSRRSPPRIRRRRASHHRASHTYRRLETTSHTPARISPCHPPWPAGSLERCSLVCPQPLTTGPAQGMSGSKNHKRDWIGLHLQLNATRAGGTLPFKRLVSVRFGFWKKDALNW